MPVRVNFEGESYEFCRDFDDNGFWIAITGRRQNIIVPIQTAVELQKIAIQSGTNPSVFTKPQKEEKEKSIRVQSKSGIKKSKTSISLSSVLKKMRQTEETDE